jgi:hypothetical protein
MLQGFHINFVPVQKWASHRPEGALEAASEEMAPLLLESLCLFLLICALLVGFICCPSDSSGLSSLDVAAQQLPGCCLA